MSVLIKGMEMPKTCYDCYFCRTYDEPNQGYFCIPLFADLHRTDFTKKRIDACPLVEVPNPHGRLIDADALKKRVQKLQEWLWDKLTDADVGIVTADDLRYRIAEESEEFIDDAPTIIESEELNG